MRTRPSLAALAILALVLAACGGDDGGDAGGGDGGDDGGLSAAEQEYADAWASSLQDDGDGLSLEDSEVACMGDAIMAELGLEPFEEAEIEAEDINAGGEDDDSPGEVLGAGVVSEEQANRILDEWEDCADLSDALARSLATELDLDDEATECVASELGATDLVRDGFLSSFTTSDDDISDESEQQLIALVEDCSASGAGSGSSLLAAGIAEGLASSSNLTDDQALCLAEGMIDIIGQDRLLAIAGDGGDLTDAPPEVQAEIGQAVLTAAEECDVPLEALDL